MIQFLAHELQFGFGALVYLKNLVPAFLHDTGSILDDFIDILYVEAHMLSPSALSREAPGSPAESVASLTTGSVHQSPALLPIWLVTSISTLSHLGLLR
jgi:hypothetical protein